MNDALYEYTLHNEKCAVCGKYCGELMPHHYITRGAGGGDDWSNLERLDMKHHQEAHTLGIKQFAIKYRLEKPRKILIDRLKWTEIDEAKFRGEI